jgi:hypothetical protein
MLLGDLRQSEIHIWWFTVLSANFLVLAFTCISPCLYTSFSVQIFLAGFWEMFDPEGYSLWFCDYKHNEENQVTFVTMNKVGGFFQRMDLARKYSFSKMCILGDSPPYKIKGVWLFRYDT